MYKTLKHFIFDIDVILCIMTLEMSSYSNLRIKRINGMLGSAAIKVSKVLDIEQFFAPTMETMKDVPNRKGRMAELVLGKHSN